MPHTRSGGSRMGNYPETTPKSSRWGKQHDRATSDCCVESKQEESFSIAKDSFIQYYVYDAAGLQWSGRGSHMRSTKCVSGTDPTTSRGLGTGVMALVLAVALIPILTSLWLLTRLYVVVRSGPAHKPGSEGSVSVLVVAGSGGHTTEILRLMGSLSAAYTPRHYVIADTDRMSEDKICSFEHSKLHSHQSQFTIYEIPRSREVQQSWNSSVFSTLSALWYSIPLVYRLRPDVVLCNGPGTCVPLCMAGLLLGILGMKKVLIVYIESICRVETLSLTGKILYHFSDYFFVQWSSLRDKYPKAIFLGRIV